RAALAPGEEAVSRRPEIFRDGRKSTYLVDSYQETFTRFSACQRSKSAPRMKNFRPIWTIRIRSSSMILRKCRTEKPASSAAFGISRNVLLTGTASVDFMFASFSREGHATGLPTHSEREFSDRRS